MDTYELTACIALWRGQELLLMKRAEGFSSGGWFLPGGHLDPGERPAEAAVRELREETGINVAPAWLSLATVMTYAHDGATAHALIYNALCPEGAEVQLNGEHAVARWYTPEAAIARFFEASMLRAKGVPEAGVRLAGEVAAAIRGAAEARGTMGDGEARAG